MLLPHRLSPVHELLELGSSIVYPFVFAVIFPASPQHQQQHLKRTNRFDLRDDVIINSSDVMLSSARRLNAAAALIGVLVVTSCSGAAEKASTRPSTLPRTVSFSTTTTTRMPTGRTEVGSSTRRLAAPTVPLPVTASGQSSIDKIFN